MKYLIIKPDMGYGGLVLGERPGLVAKDDGGGAECLDGLKVLDDAVPVSRGVKFVHTVLYIFSRNNLSTSNQSQVMQ